MSLTFKSNKPSPLCRKKDNVSFPTRKMHKKGGGGQSLPKTLRSLAGLGKGCKTSRIKASLQWAFFCYCKNRQKDIPRVSGPYLNIIWNELLCMQIAR